MHVFWSYLFRGPAFNIICTCAVQLTVSFLFITENSHILAWIFQGTIYQRSGMWSTLVMNSSRHLTNSSTGAQLQYLTVYLTKHTLPELCFFWLCWGIRAQYVSTLWFQQQGGRSNHFKLFHYCKHTEWYSEHKHKWIYIIFVLSYW